MSPLRALAPLLILTGALGVGCGLVTLLPAPAGAQEGLDGTWQYAGDEAERAGRLRSIERATAGLNRFAQGRVRGRLQERTEPRPFRLTVRGDEMELSSEGRTVRLQIGGPAVTVEGGRVEARRQGGNLVVVSRGENGTQTTFYQLWDEGRRLTLRVSLSSGRLSAPVIYSATYRRG
ncbi:MAG: hypothetical protein ACFCGT_25350 [Sandaracinaceae bacterium]